MSVSHYCFVWLSLSISLRLTAGSVREPTQVFTLLETIYHAFDEIARHRRVFKVETIGDCYGAHCLSISVIARRNYFSHTYRAFLFI